MNLLGDLFDGPLADVLTCHASTRLNAEKDSPGAAVQHRAKRAYRRSTLTTRRLELQRLRPPAVAQVWICASVVVIVGVAGGGDP